MAGTSRGAGSAAATSDAEYAEFAPFAQELASDVVITGRLSFPASVLIEGRLAGEIRSRDLLVVGRAGQVRADILGKRIVVLGRVEGNVYASEHVEIRPGATVIGTLEAPAVTVREGALLHGHCKLGVSGKA